MEKPKVIDVARKPFELSSKINIIEPKQQQPQISATVNEEYPNAEHVFNAIKLTNYYTNLLSNPETNELIDLKISGSRWRNKQLAYQIPHQDIKLLASSTSKESFESSLSTSRDDNESMDQQRTRSAASIKSQSEDEINFIRGQRKLASQFKASLFYLSPVRQIGPSQSWSAKKASKKSSACLEQRDQSSKSVDDSTPNRVHQCFKVSFLTPINCVHCDDSLSKLQTGCWLAPAR